jgi:hypothetical protein
MLICRGSVIRPKKRNRRSFSPLQRRTHSIPSHTLRHSYRCWMRLDWVESRSFFRTRCSFRADGRALIENIRESIDWSGPRRWFKILSKTVEYVCNWRELWEVLKILHWILLLLSIILQCTWNLYFLWSCWDPVRFIFKSIWLNLTL